MLGIVRPTDRHGPRGGPRRDPSRLDPPYGTYDGLLVSKAIVDGTGTDGGRYTIAQRQRLLREGVRTFFRIEGRPIETMGDCGAFSYVGECRPPFSVQDVIDFT